MLKGCKQTLQVFTLPKKHLCNFRVHNFYIIPQSLSYWERRKNSNSPQASKVTNDVVETRGCSALFPTYTDTQQNFRFQIRLAKVEAEIPLPFFMNAMTI